MAKTDQYTTEQMIEALTKANGMITHACRYLGCDYKTMKRYINKYKSVQEAYENTQHVMGDNIETTLLDQALGRRDKTTGEWIQEPNVTALIFLAKVHPEMRRRGYAERRELANAPGESLKIEVVYGDYNPKLPD